MPAPVLELRRVLLAADGRLKGQFSDNSILLVNESGSAFMCLSPDGVTTTRQLSEYALTKHSPQLAVLLEFRNMHVDVPFFCKPLLRCTQGAFSLGYRIAEVWWPRDVAEAKHLELLQTLADGRLALSSEDHTARVVLHVHRRRFAVCYPLLVQADQAAGKHEYLWHNQAFSLQSYPPRWRPAVRLLLQEASNTDCISDSKQGLPEPHAQPSQQHTTHTLHHLDLDSGTSSSGLRFENPHGQQSGDWTADWVSSDLETHQPHSQQLPSPHRNTHSQHQSHQNQHHGEPPLSTKHTSSQHQQGHSFGYDHSANTTHHSTDSSTARVLTYNQPCSQLPTAVGRDLCGICDGFPEPSWWQEPTLSLLPPDDIIILEWVPQATYQFHPEQQEVEVWVHIDESCLSSCKQGRYLLHCKGLQSPDRLYEASCVPELVWSCDRGERYGLAQLAAHALKMRGQMSAIQVSQTLMAGTQTSSAPTRPSHKVPSHLDSSFAVLSEEVVEHCTDENGTRLMAYADGRVRAVFTDRTILHTNASLSHCKVTLPDGKTLTVSSGSPVGVEVYVAAAVRFAEWAFLTRAQRQDIRRAHAAVKAELVNSTRMAQLCDFSVHGKVPKPAAPFSGSELTAIPSLADQTFARDLYGRESADVHLDRQAAIEQLLRANAELILRM